MDARTYDRRLEVFRQFARETPRWSVEMVDGQPVVVAYTDHVIARLDGPWAPAVARFLDVVCGDELCAIGELLWLVGNGDIRRAQVCAERLLTSLRLD